jgi:hypothetical protein
MFNDTRETALADVTQNRILAGKITEKGRLADLENVNDIVDPGGLVPMLAEQSKGSLDDLLAQSCLLTFAKSQWRVRGR